MFMDVSASAANSVSVSGSNLTWVVIVAVVGLLALGVAGVLVREVLAASQGTAKMQEIAKAVQEGAAAYLRRQFRTLGVFVVIIFFILLVLPAVNTDVRWGRSAFFLLGALFSGLTGFTGMSLTVRGNVRVAAAAREDGSNRAMRIAFRTGGVAGMFTVGLGLLGATIVVLIYKANAPDVLEGFGFGAALLAMFMRVGGGIYTKAADVGADLVGKVEQGIPEDDPRNAATIADNVGDNVGDCAGMAADLFESYSVMLVASLILGKVAFGNDGLVIPLFFPAIGIITAVIGIFVVRPRAGDRSGMSAINRGFFVSAILSVIGVAIACFTYLPDKFSKLKGITDTGILHHGSDPQWIAFGAGGKLLKWNVTGGQPPQIVCNADMNYGSWGDDGVILAAPGDLDHETVPPAKPPAAQDRGPEDHNLDVAGTRCRWRPRSVLLRLRLAAPRRRGGTW